MILVPFVFAVVQTCIKRSGTGRGGYDACKRTSVRYCNASPRSPVTRATFGARGPRQSAMRSRSRLSTSSLLDFSTSRLVDSTIEQWGVIELHTKAESCMEIIEIRIRSGQFEAQTGKVTWRFREKSPEFSMNLHLAESIILRSPEMEILYIFRPSLTSYFHRMFPRMPAGISAGFDCSV